VAVHGAGAPWYETCEVGEDECALIEGATPTAAMRTSGVVACWEPLRLLLLSPVPRPRLLPSHRPEETVTSRGAPEIIAPSYMTTTWTGPADASAPAVTLSCGSPDAPCAQTIFAATCAAAGPLSVMLYDMNMCV